ncbi:hypothetical protein C3747_7g327 [Trypanosoma cruzi]|uniref:Transmembrane protein n=2 Tax=Trypanosoma cruzi TaxID=5693 RepID=Q4DRC5_TRYCC|nr:hypothetical protein, conserved [Trypanosoma cruzi]EAN95064.1 hypothetical protein, conserved [Trypanosoma cruzi]PWV20298.1 hypothetical protein C3747_7g327 [Trypanosoma cruzi]|eukprot:XP_816915.1 hypothetical protein [Trypanosoma cruzi strain CL Brener]
MKRQKGLMYAHCRARLAAAAFGSSLSSGNDFSSAAFTGDDCGEHARREFARTQHVADTTDTFSSSSTVKSRPTIDTYRSMSSEELETLLRTREKQVQQLRAIYENFHYEADKRFRTMVFDYHEKAMNLSQVHGKMQLGSLQISREALVKLREQQEMYSRDHRLMVAICTLFTFVFWVWVRRHYVRHEDLFGDDSQLRIPKNQRSVTGMGSYNENLFGSAKRSARNMETSWEREVRERRERQEREIRQ